MASNRALVSFEMALNVCVHVHVQYQTSDRRRMAGVWLASSRFADWDALTSYLGPNEFAPPPEQRRSIVGLAEADANALGGGEGCMDIFLL